MVRSSTERTPTFYAGCAAWAGACYWLVRNGLGVVAIVGSILITIFVFGLRDKFEEGESMSAYNVFNKGGKAIMGSLTGDQVDAQLRGGIRFGKPDNSGGGGNTQSDKPLTTTATLSGAKKQTEHDKLKRRANAAAAAERRMQQQREEVQ